MASPQAPQKFIANNKVTSYAIDTNLTTAADIDEWVDMRDYEEFFVIATGINLSGVGVDELHIITQILPVAIQM